MMSSDAVYREIRIIRARMHDFHKDIEHLRQALIAAEKVATLGGKDQIGVEAPKELPSQSDLPF